MGASVVVSDSFLNMLRNIAPTIVRDGGYISLHTADPGATGVSEVPFADAYARQLIPAAGWDAPLGVIGVNRHIPNNALVQFPVPGGTGWGTITHLGIWIHATNATAADFWGGGALTDQTKVAGAGADVNFPIAAARWQMG